MKKSNMQPKSDKKADSKGNRLLWQIILLMFLPIAWGLISFLQFSVRTSQLEVSNEIQQAFYCWFFSLVGLFLLSIGFSYSKIYPIVRIIYLSLFVLGIIGLVAVRQFS